jgi:hypothetical protein
MEGRIPRQGGRYVRSGSRAGVVYDESPTEAAFRRWQLGEFYEVERLYARAWRHDLTSLDLSKVADAFRQLGIDGKRYKTLDDLKQVAADALGRSDKPFDRLKLAVIFFDVPLQYHESIIRTWEMNGQRALTEHAPYTAYVLTVEIFFQLALAANLISSARPSNRTDIAYLFYLPFSIVFVSGDKLHRKCASLFLRADQEFVWAPELKADLVELNRYYLALPEAERDEGVMRIAGRRLNRPIS